MMAVWFLVVLALVFAVVWINLARKPGPRAKIGPDGTNVREPETFVVHHEGKGQSIDIANTALKERTENMRRDLPGEAHKINTPIPGRDMVKMDAPPSDVSKYGDVKIAPGAVPGKPGAETKEKVLTEGPQGSRPGTAEEPGSPFAKGRRVTDNHRDVELAAEVLPDVWAGQGRHPGSNLAVSPSTTGREPGYGLGRTGPGETDGEGGEGDDDHANTPYPVEQPDLTDDIPDLPEGDMPSAAAANSVGPLTGRPPAARRGRVVPLKTADWSGLREDIPLSDTYGEDTVVALVRNPRSLYVYWERSGFGEENLRSMLGTEWNRAVPVLRVFDVTTGAHPGQPGGHSFAIQVGENDDHWFINEGIEPGHRYVVSYERGAPDGKYYLLSHSAPVETPHQTPAEASWLYQQYGRQPGQWSGSPWR